VIEEPLKMAFSILSIKNEEREKKMYLNVNIPEDIDLL